MIWKWLLIYVVCAAYLAYIFSDVPTKDEEDARR